MLKNIHRVPSDCPHSITVMIRTIKTINGNMSEWDTESVDYPCERMKHDVGVHYAFIPTIGYYQWFGRESELFRV